MKSINYKTINLKTISLKTIGLKTSTPKTFRKFVAAMAMVVTSSMSFASGLEPLVDNFDDPAKNNLGFERIYMNDSLAGGKTSTQQKVSKGILHVSGDLTPPRGQPAWASSVLPLNLEGQSKDASKFEGIRLLLKVNEGQLSISANSTEITNFDYHAAPIAITADGKFHEVKIPFTSMKRAWSEQTSLNTETITSLSIVAFSPQKASFEYEIDEVSFY